MYNITINKNTVYIDDIVLFEFISKDKIITFSFIIHKDVDFYCFSEILNLFTNFMIKKFKVIKLKIKKENVNKYYKSFYECMYYEYKEYLIRSVEAYRYLIDENAFDNKGFIINQSKLKIIPFKMFKTDKKGCGWIAVYNFLKIIHREKTIKEVSQNVSKYALFFGAIGQDIFTILYYLRKNNINVFLTPIFKRQCIRDIKMSKAGIILYIHSRGSHYVAYKNLGNGKCLLYNVVYGKENHIMNIEEFYKKYSITPLGMLLFVNEV